MTIRDLQKQIADVLNGVEALVQHGCKVFAEDMLTTQDALNNAVATALFSASCVVSMSSANTLQPFFRRASTPFKAAAIRF